MKILNASVLALAMLYSGFAMGLEFTLHKLESSVAGPTLLVIGGIQGDEPGGFTAASLLVNDYQVTKGQVWIVPNLNFDSIISRSRGIYGDMNRKFSTLRDSDPEFETIAKIKAIIKNPQVSMILNLHDGSGFYNEMRIDKDENPRRWGQSIVIDQSTILADQYGDIEAVAKQMISRVNRLTSDSKAQFRLKNTRTREGDKEMEKTLTYFAINNGKAAMGIEASKNYPTHVRTLQHLRVLESMMDTMGIAYSRNFELNAKSVYNKIGRNIQIALFDNMIRLDLDNSRQSIGYVPMKKRAPVEFTTNNPLVAVVKSKQSYKVRYGNRGVTILNPQHFLFDNSLQSAEFEIDGKNRLVSLGTVVNVNESFLIKPIKGHRVNIIGYKRSGHRNESGLSVRKHEIMSRFSVDKQANKFRVEFYKGKKYSGMVLVNFVGDNKLARN